VLRVIKIILNGSNKNKTLIFQKMERKVLLINIFSVLVIALSLAGFYSSYISHFPNFSHFKWVTHLHFAAFCCWFVLILVQPVLIRKRKFELHKKLGRLSHFLIPVLVLTIIVLRAGKLNIEVKASLPDASMNAFVTLMDLLSLSGYYLIAVWNAKNLRWHVAFILATSLVILNPGLARLLNIISPGSGMLVILVPFIFTITVFVVEKIKYKRSILKSPYFTFFLLWLLEILLLFIIPTTQFWQDLIKDLAVQNG